MRNRKMIQYRRHVALALSLVMSISLLSCKKEDSPHIEQSEATIEEEGHISSTTSSEETTEHSDYLEIVHKPDIADIETAINEASQFAWNWFYYPKEVDQNDVIALESGIDMDDGNIYFYAMTAERIKSKSDLKQLARTYFAESAIDNLMNEEGFHQLFVEQDGKLYIWEPWGLSGGTIVDALYISVAALSDSNYEITVYGLYYQGTPHEKLSEPEVIHYYLEDGNWVFDSVLCYLDEWHNPVPIYPYE